MLEAFSMLDSMQTLYRSPFRHLEVRSGRKMKHQRTNNQNYKRIKDVSARIFAEVEGYSSEGKKKT